VRRARRGLTAAARFRYRRIFCSWHQREVRRRVLCAGIVQRVRGADRVIIGGDENFLSEDILNHVRCVCSERDIALDFLPDLIGLNNPPVPRLAIAKSVKHHNQGAVASPSRYFIIKRLVDFVLALIAILLLA
jgi:hypothetical protein